MKRLTLLLIGVVLIATVIFGVYLSYKKSLGTKKAKAAENVFNSLEVSQVRQDGSVQPVHCSGKVCESKSLQLKIKLNPGKVNVSCKPSYEQCGGTTGLESYESGHLYRVTPICDVEGNVVDYNKEDLGHQATCS